MILITKGVARKKHLFSLWKASVEVFILTNKRPTDYISWHLFKKFSDIPLKWKKVWVIVLKVVSNNGPEVHLLGVLPSESPTTLRKIISIQHSLSCEQCWLVFKTHFYLLSSEYNYLLNCIRIPYFSGLEKVLALSNLKLCGVQNELFWC